MGHPLWQSLSEFVNQQFLLGVVTGLALSLLTIRLGSRRKEKNARALTAEGDRAFFKGIQYILSNDHDQAIEEFTKSVQLNSDTIETYVALGNLYRSKGDIDRAIRIRQSIILRPNIDEQIKMRALFDLGLDFRKGAFLNHALETLLKVLEKRPSDLETLKEIEKIYEEMKDWENACRMRRKISKLAKGRHAHIIAHHQTEMGKALLEKGDPGKAKSCFKSALSADEGCVDAYLHLGDLHFERQEYRKAIAAWKKVVSVAPQFTFLAYRRLEGAYAKMQNIKPVGDFLRDCAQLNTDAFTHLALARYLYNERDYQGALRELDNALALDPAFWEARKFKGELLLGQGMKEEALAAYKELVGYLNVPYLKFQCTDCGYRPPDLCWQCPQCREWDTIGLMDSGTVESSHPPNSRIPVGDPSRRSPEEDL